MRNYVKNKMMNRLTYCKDWKNTVEIYLEGKKITDKTNKEFYKYKPILKIILDLYYLPYNMFKMYSYLKIIHEYKKNETEIKILSKELNEIESKYD
jgi:hypothetical protein